MNRGSDLTQDERYLIFIGLLSGLRQVEVADMLGRSPSAVCEEVKRGQVAGKYCPATAQWSHERARQRSAGNVRRKPDRLWQKVRKQLKQGLTPDEVAGRMRLLAEPVNVSFQGIYAHVKRHGWQRYLKSVKRRSHLKRPAKRRWHGEAMPIRLRSEEANRRIERGHFEADTMVGKRRDQKRVLVIVERQTLWTQLSLVQYRKPRSVARTLRHRVVSAGIPFESVATDRGIEFTDVGRQVPGKAYICDPHAPNQRGTNENQIGRVRVDLPKGVSLDKLSHRKLKQIEHKHNHTPRKAIGYLTPFEVAFNNSTPIRN